MTTFKKQSLTNKFKSPSRNLRYPGRCHKHLNKLLYILLLILIPQAGCTQVVKSDTLFYPSKSRFNSNNHRLKKIDLISSHLNFKEIGRLVNETHRNNKIPYFKTGDLNLIRMIIPLRYDWGLYKERNDLIVTEDSVSFAHEKSYPIDKLYDQLEAHYFNNGKNPARSEDTEKAYIKIFIDSSRTGGYLAKHLNLIAREFDKFNQEHSDSLNLKIILDYPGRIPPPPPGNH